MKIKSDLVFKKSTGQLVGFTELGDINDEFALFEKSLNEENDVLNREFTTHVLVFMVRAITGSFCHPFAYFGSVGFTSAQLYPVTFQAAGVLESMGFLVRAFVCDGASPNRKFFKIIRANEIDIHYTINPWDRSRRIYLISDVPHLIKTTRNCFENSFYNQNTRNMHVSLMNVARSFMNSDAFLIHG